MNSAQIQAYGWNMKILGILCKLNTHIGALTYFFLLEIIIYPNWIAQTY